MSGLRTLGFLLLAPFLVGGVVIGGFGFGSYNVLIVPAILLGEAILVLAEIIKIEKEEIEAEFKNESNGNNKNE